MERKKTHRLVVALLVLAAHNVVTCSAGETQSLIEFKGSLSNATALSNWDVSSDSPCTGNLTHWAGVWCLNGNVWQLRLDGMGLGGLLDVDSLAQLPNLRVLSIKGNSFGGPMLEVEKLPALKSLLMSSNRFLVGIPDGRVRWDGGAEDGLPGRERVHRANAEIAGEPAEARELEPGGESDGREDTGFLVDGAADGELGQQPVRGEDTSGA
ncbi:hypothetical protein NL676_034910 [Syzygium grande]|nr:hypothetical protein NL676_034910 [Syzygium grande]